MLKIQSVNHVSEHLSAIYPVYTKGGGYRPSPACGGGLKRQGIARGHPIKTNAGFERTRHMKEQLKVLFSP